MGCRGYDHGPGRTDTLTFAGFSGPLTFNLDAGSFTVSNLPNTVTNVGYQIETLIGGSGNDIFNMNAPATANLDGGGGSNTLDYSSYGSPVTLDLGAGTVTGLTGTFTNIRAFVGGGIDTLVGYASGTIFNITGANSGNINGTFNFSGVANLSGSANADTFAFGNSGSLSGSISAGAGSDTLTFSGVTTARSITLDAGYGANGFSGTGTSLGSFSGIDVLTGGNGSDTLTGANAAAIFEVDGTNCYIVSPFALAFSSFENLLGGSVQDTFQISGSQTANLNGNAGNDSFSFANGANLTGSISGGANADTLDLSAYATGRSIVLNGVGANGFNGSSAIISAGFSGLDNLIGSTTAATDSLTGLNAVAAFNLGALTYTSGAQTLTFSNFEILTGGSQSDTFDLPGVLNFTLNGNGGNDTFVFHNSTNLTGHIDGGLGTDTLDYSAVTINVTVNLATGSATGVNSGAINSVVNVENFTGGSGTNTIYGDAGNNILVGGSSNDNFYGGLGDDTYIFTDGWGQDHVYEYPGQGNDTLDFSGVTGTGLTFTFNGTVFSVTDDGTNNVFTDKNVENYIGTGQADSFVFQNGAIVPGNIVGGSGTDTLDFSSYGSARNFVLTALGTHDGFKGTVNGIGGTFDDIDALIGTTVYTDLSTGLNATATWHVNTGVDQYETSARLLDHSLIETLVGGSGNDTFAFQDTATFSGSFNGNAGTDTLDYSAYTTAVCANLSAANVTVGLVTAMLAL